MGGREQITINDTADGGAGNGVSDFVVDDVPCGIINGGGCDKPGSDYDSSQYGVHDCPFNDFRMAVMSDVRAKT